MWDAIMWIAVVLFVSATIITGMVMGSYTERTAVENGLYWSRSSVQRSGWEPRQDAKTDI